MLKNYNLRRKRTFCGLFSCKKQDCLITDVSAQIKSGSKYAIIADAAHGKTTLLNSLMNHRSAFKA